MLSGSASRVTERAELATAYRLCRLKDAYTLDKDAADASGFALAACL
jgi:hypothetical protein